MLHPWVDILGGGDRERSARGWVSPRYVRVKVDRTRLYFSGILVQEISSYVQKYNTLQ